MANLNEHFDQSAYTIHRAALKRKYLPRCCHDNLKALKIGIKFIKRGSGEELLPLVECAVCSRKYALSGDRYMAVSNLLRFEIAEL